VIGWAVSNRLKRDLAIRAHDMAIALRKPPPDAFITRIAAANIAAMIIKSGYASTISKCR